MKCDWPGHMPEPMGRFSMKWAHISGAYACEYLSVKSVHNRKTSFRVPGQTPGLVVHSLEGPLVLTDRQNRRHSIWIY